MNIRIDGETIVVAFLISLFMSLALLVMGLVAFSAITLMGWYHFDYRCTDSITEKREYIGALPVGGWETVDGGRCERAGA